MSHLLEFYGKECPHCQKMREVSTKLEKELGVSLVRHEVWHDDKNVKLMESCDKGFCGGVPFFYNTETKKWICGEASYDELKEWAGK